jgi:glycosyltransferase involved in cell wall biosynthesis
VRRYAEALAQRGDCVDIMALGQEGSRNFDVIDGVNLYRIQNRVLNEKSKVSYLIRIVKFLFRSAIILSKRHLRTHYHLIHVHNLPDFLVFAALVPKLLGGRIILDIHDILPEYYATKFREAETGFPFKVLKLVEKASCRFSDHVIVSNHIWQDTLLFRSIKEKKCTVILNYPNQTVFYKRQRTRENGKLIMIYPGTWNWHQGIDIPIKALGIIKDQVPSVEFHIYGAGNDGDLLERLIYQNRLQDRVFLRKGVPREEIAEVISDADIGVEPKRREGFANEALSMKIFEFMASGIPVIASDTKVHRYYFNDSVLKFFKAGDENDLAKCMLMLIKNSELRKQLVANASKFIQEYTWEKKKDEYLKLVDSLTTKKC